MTLMNRGGVVMLLLVLAASLHLMHTPAAGASGEEAADALRYGRRRGRGRPRHTHPPPTPTPPTPPRPRPSPSPSLCNRSWVPDSVGDVVSPCPSLTPPPPPCFCRPPPPAQGAPPSSPADCVTAMAGLASCGNFLTGSQDGTPSPESECCGGLGAFLNASAAAGANDRILRCLCPVILGDVNKMLPKPIDPVRMMYLPIACGVVLPPQILYICFTGHRTPAVVDRFSQLWE